MNAAVTQMRSDTTAMRPFQVNVPEAELTELRRRIKATRLPEKEPVADMSQGVPLATVEKLTNCARASDHCADSQQEAASSMLRRGWATDIVIESAVGDYPVFVCVECCDRSRTSTRKSVSSHYGVTEELSTESPNVQYVNCASSLPAVTTQATRSAQGVRHSG